MTQVLTVGYRGKPWFGPRVFDDASLCPAKAAVSIQGFSLPTGSTAEPCSKLSGGAWLAAANLLSELAYRGPTSAYLAGRQSVSDLTRLAATEMPRESRSVRDFAIAAIENLLEAQAATVPSAFDYYPTFIKMPFGSGEMHAGGAFAFNGPAGKWQLWRLRMSTARPPDDAALGWALTAAYCLAGHLDQERHDPLRTAEVFEVGATGGPPQRIGAWTRAALDASFTALTSRALRDMASNLQVKGGSHCEGCPFVGNCPAAPRIEGLLQFVPRQPTVRKVTATDLRNYADCARRYQLLTVEGLPGEPLTGGALQRGDIVDAWLRLNHGRGIACNDADVQRLIAEADNPEAAAVARHHLGICPLADPDTSSLTAHPYVTALDAKSRVLLVARPDAIYRRDTGVVWRETKTHATLTPLAAEQLVETDVAAALYLVLLASGANGTPDALEWEELTAADHELTILATDDDALVEAARARVSASVADLLSDTHYSPRIGPRCTQCAVRDWCPDAP